MGHSGVSHPAAPATRFDGLTPSSGPDLDRDLVTHTLVNRDFASPQELEAGRSFFTASLAEKAAALDVQVYWPSVVRRRP
jgi:hypothetical protein